MTKEREYKGLEEAINQIPTVRNTGILVQISYDMDEDDVLYNVHVGEGSRTEYENPRILRIGFFQRRVSPARLKELIEETIELRREYCCS